MAQQVLQDGFVTLCINTSLNFWDGKTRMLIEGQYTPLVGIAVPVIPDMPIVLNSVLDVDALFNPGCILSEAARYAFETCPSNVQITVLPRLDAVSAVAAVFNLTITGPATSAGTIDLFVGEMDYAVSVPVALGDTVATIAANAAALFSARFPFAVTPLVVATVTTGIKFTAKNAGTIGNQFNLSVNYTGLRGRMPTGVTVGPLTQATVGSVDPSIVNYATALGQCCYDVYTLMSPSVTWQNGLNVWLQAAWSCAAPQCFGAGYVYRLGASSPSIVATGQNAQALCIAAVNQNDVVFGWLTTVCYAAQSACTARQNPELSIQGFTYGVLNAIIVPQTCQTYWGFNDYTLLQANGFVTFGPVSQGSGQLSNLYIYNDVTNYLTDNLGRPNATFRDANSLRLTRNVAVQLATLLDSFSGLAAFIGNTQIAPGIFGTNQNLMLAAITAWAKSQVGILFGTFANPQAQIVLTSSFQTSPPCQGLPGVFALIFSYAQPMRIKNIGVTLMPSDFQNCAR